MYGYNQTVINGNISGLTDLKNINAYRPAKPEDLDQNLFETNLEFWRSRYPQLGEVLAHMELSESRLLIDGEGNFDIEYKGKALFGEITESISEEPYGQFCKVQRILDDPGGPEGLEGEGVLRIHQQVEDALGFRTPPHLKEPESYFLVVLGLGLGDQLERLAKVTRCQNLILVEPNIEFLYLSFFTFDWPHFIDTHFSDGKSFGMINLKDAVFIEGQFRLCVSKAPHYVDGLTVVTTYADPLLDEVSKRITSNAIFLNSGVGFILDECDMLRNAYHNLKNHRGYIYEKQSKNIPIPAFVVGSAPSFDESIDVIKKYEDRALIISCGTTLGLLLGHGVIPDIHVEIENTPEIRDIIAHHAKSYDLSAVRLFASYTIAPKIEQYFATTIYYFRANLSPKAIFSDGTDKHTLNFDTPTVANLGIVLAQELGCEAVYMMGVDLGARDVNKHHAVGSMYEHEWVPYDDVLDITMPSNFNDGVVLTDLTFLWAKDSLEWAATKFFGPDIERFNCGTGLLINGMKPLRAAEISLKELEKPKREIIDPIISQYPRYTETDFAKAWNRDELYKSFDIFKRELLSYVDFDHSEFRLQHETVNCNREERRKQKKLQMKKKGASQLGDTGLSAALAKNKAIFELDFMDKLTRKLYHVDRKSINHHFFSGPLFYTIRLIYYYGMRVAPGKDRDKIIGIILNEFKSQIDGISDQVLSLYDGLD